VAGSCWLRDGPNGSAPHFIDPPPSHKTLRPGFLAGDAVQATPCGPGRPLRRWAVGGPPDISTKEWNGTRASAVNPPTAVRRSSCGGQRNEGHWGLVGSIGTSRRDRDIRGKARGGRTRGWMGCSESSKPPRPGGLDLAPEPCGFFFTVRVDCSKKKTQSFAGGKLVATNLTTQVTKYRNS